MMHKYISQLIFISAFISSCLSLVSCSGNEVKEVTISSLAKKPLVLEEPVDIKLNRKNAATYYQDFLKSAPPGNMYGNAMRRLADLQLQTGQEKSESSREKEITESHNNVKNSIRLYTAFLETYPNKKNNDLVLYQLAKAYEINLQRKKMLATLNKIIEKYPNTQYIEEVQFRRGESYFILKEYKKAELAYRSIIDNHPESPYYEKSLYKYGWTRFKQLDYKHTSKIFIAFLDRKHQQGQLVNAGAADSLSRSDRELLNDVLRVTSLSFSYQSGHRSLTRFFNDHGHRPYEPLLYRNLAELYFEKDRIRDAAQTYLAYTKAYPVSRLAPEFHSKAIESYQKGGFASLVLPAKVSFVNQYGVGTAYWKVQQEDARKEITPLLKLHIRELANHYHAVARKTKYKPGSKNKKQRELNQVFEKSIVTATKWYKVYIRSFPEHTGTEEINFLLAEAHQDAGQYRNAIYQFEKTAYQYPEHKKRQEAAYAALLLYPAIQNKLKGQEKLQWQQKKFNSAIRFADNFPGNKHTASILANTSEEMFKAGEFNRAIITATRLSAHKKLSKKLLISSLLVIGHAEFELQNYHKSEDAYYKLIRLLPNKHKEYRNTYERLAASIYKQGDKAKSSNKLAIAAEFYLRVGKETPASKLRANADYDAATIYISLEKWDKSKSILEAFRKNYPKSHTLQFGVTEKLALVYTKTGQSLKAAEEMIYLANNAKQYTSKQRRELHWQAAIIYKENNKRKKALAYIKTYIKKYPAPLEPAIEARQLLADMYEKNNRSQHYYWLREIIKADNAGGKARSRRTHYLAATAYMKLTLPLFKSYTAAKLTIPLKKSLKVKKNLMEKVVKSYDNAMKYRVAEITTSATYYIGEIYNDFASTLLKSQRPQNLSADELEEYNVLLEEQAYPFEEKAIDIHIANAERVKDNIYDKWVQRSLEKLSKLIPIRFAKYETGEKYVEAIQ